MKMEAGLRAQSKEGGQGKRIAMRLAVLIVGILLCNIAPTQYLASQFSYDSVLGGAVIGHFYWPWSWVVWATDYYTNYPGLFQNALKIAVAGLVVLVMIWATVIFMTSRKGKPIQNLHGSAHWATEDEVPVNRFPLPENYRINFNKANQAWQGWRGQDPHRLRVPKREPRRGGCPMGGRPVVRDV